MEPRINATCVNISELTEANSRLSAALLIMQSLPAYYEVSGIRQCEMATAVAELIGARGSELERGFAAVRIDEVVGILTYLCSHSLSKARIVGTQALLRRLSTQSATRFRRHLQAYNAGFGAISVESLYLARFAVAAHLRGTSLAGEMMHRFLSMPDAAGIEQEQFSLHVDRENSRAISFYRKHGFKVSHVGSQYLMMLYSSRRSECEEQCG